MRIKDVNENELLLDNNGDVTESTLRASMGEVQETPTQYTVLARLKDIITAMVSGLMKFMLTDQHGHIADVDTLGRLYVATNPPEPPIGTTPVKEGGTYAGWGKSGAVIDGSWLITNTEEFLLSEFVAGGYMPSVVSETLQIKCELIYRPNGAGSVVGEELVSVIYLHGQSFGHQAFAETKATGDGIKAMYWRITNWSAKDVEVTVFMKGHTTSP
ncbi:MAG: hypothetical protein ACTSQZ_02005 [Candidatus Thorarchaeota archaeon]